MDKLTQLDKAYSKRFKQLNKNMMTSSDSGLILLVEHLKYLRDVCIVTEKPADIIATLDVAIEEFDAFRKTKKEFHWNNFCEFVKLNMKEWLVANDSV